MAELLFPEQTVSGFAMSGYGYYLASLGNTTPFVPETGEVYIVVWDGVEHICVSFEFVTEGALFIGIGNTLVADGIDSGKPFTLSYNTGLSQMFIFSADTEESHTVAVFKHDNAIILKDRNADEMIFTDVNAVKLNTLGGGSQVFSLGEATEGSVESLDFSDGPMVITPEKGRLFSSVQIPVPQNLAAENIAAGIEIAGVTGTLTAGSGDALFDYENTSAPEIGGYAYSKMNTLRSVHFTKASSISNAAFQSCGELVRAEFDALTGIGAAAFSLCSKLTALILRSETDVPTIAMAALSGTAIQDGTGYVYVPASMLEAYQSSSAWSTHAGGQIRTIEEYPEICG